MAKSSIYIMGKLRSDEGAIDVFAEELEKRGHTVLAKWWEMDQLPTPYLDFPETSSAAAKIMIEAAQNSDIAILFPSDTILGAAVEFGAALGSTRANTNKKVIIVSSSGIRQSVFYAHPKVILAQGIASMRKMDWY